MNRKVALLVLALVVASCAETSTYSRAVQDFLKFKNEGDVEAVLDMFADNPSLHFGELGTITGLDEIRGILEYDRVLDAQLRFENCVATDRDVACRVVETNDWLGLADIESITYDENRFTFTIDGRIESVASTLSAESAEVLGKATGEFGVWASTNEPVEYAALFSEYGTFVYSEENGEKVLALLRQWRAE